MDEVVAALGPFAAAPNKGGMGSSIGMGGTTSPELAEFLKTMGPKPVGSPTLGARPATIPRAASRSPHSGTEPVEMTAAFVAPEAGTDPKSEILAKGSTEPESAHPRPDGRGGRRKRPPMKLISGGVGGMALLMMLGVWIVVRDKTGNEVARVEVPPGGDATVVTTEPPRPTASPVATPFFPIRRLPNTMFVGESNLPPGDYALDFSATGAVVNMPSVEADPTGPLTIECWLRLTSDDATTGVSSIIGNNKKFWVTQKKGTVRPLSLQGNTADRHFTISSKTGRLPVGPRVHLAAVRDGSQARLYLDGKRIAEADDFVGPFQDAKAMFVLGRGLPGRIDEARISKVARYAADFTPETRITPDAGATALYHFEEGEGGVLRDSSGNEHHGQIVNAAWVRADGSPIRAVAASTAPPVAPIPTSPTAQATPAEPVATNIKTPRELAEWAIRRGGTVLFDKKSIKDVAQLPADATQFMIRLDNVKDVDDATLVEMGSWPVPIRNLGLTNTAVHGEGFTAFRGKPFGNLSVPGCKLTLEGVRAIAALGSINQLYIGNTNLDDAGLAELGRHVELQNLSIHGNPVTDAGLAHLEGLKKLVRLSLQGTKVTAAGVAKLQRALPGCVITWQGAAPTAADDEAFNIPDLP